MGKIFDASSRNRNGLPIILILLTSVASADLARHEDGVLVSYEKFVELLDPSTGDVKAKFNTNLKYVSDLLVINGTSQSVVLSELVDGSKTNLHLALLGPDGSTFFRIAPEKKFPLIKSMAYDWRRSVLHILQSGQIDQIDFQTWMVRSLKVPSTARSVAVDSCHSILYWASETGIYRHDQGVDSSSHAVVLQNASQPDNLVVSGRHLYWMEKFENGHKVERLDLETYEKITLCEHVKKGQRVSVYSMAVDSETRTLYWADWHNSAVWKIDFGSRDNSEECNPVVVRDLGTIRPLGVGIVRNSVGSDDLEKRCDHSKKQLLTKVKVATKKVNKQELRYEGEVDQCLNYCFDHELDPSSFANFENDAIVFWSSCSYEKSVGAPVCQCQTGFSGSRCQIDPCKNFCLNGGKCLRQSNRHECLCPTNFSGDRCEVPGSGERPLIFYLFLVTVVFLGILIAVAILLICENSRVRRKLEEALEISKNNPDTKKQSDKPLKVFSLTRSQLGRGRSSKGDHCYTNEICGTFEEGKCRGDGNGVVLDLEDCCHMTMCDTPCVEASFVRRPRKRTKSRNISTSQLEDGKDDDTRKLMSNGIQS